MRSRAAFVLLFCFGWHLVAPLAAWAVRRQFHRGEEISAQRDAESLNWVPRTADTRELLRAPERQTSRLCVGRGCSAQPASHVIIAHAPKRYATARRSVYPARCLHMTAGAADDGPPA
jgi:hypothetical protein